MTVLTIFPETGSATPEIIKDHGKISKILEGIGVQFEKWDTPAKLDHASGQSEILAAYESQVARLKTRHNFQSADVVSLNPDNPEREILRKKFLNEHTHTDFEIRFFVDGSGLFYLHLHKMVYGILCVKGDLISVPANTPHWFDMGSKPEFKCIRLFSDPSGWVGHLTESNISTKFPDFDTFADHFA
jgi:1,2-dihydroxy-3-keto-5-methylthiopentene dioxygenase